jgi:uncharacterized protein YndB with AHSA1/START domain
LIRVEIHETVDRPIEEVFEKLIDIDAYPEWMPDSWFYVTSRKDSEGPPRVGTRYTDVTRAGAVRGEIAELDPPRRVVFHYEARMFGRTMMHGWPGYTLESIDDGGTRLHHVAEGRLQGLFKLLRPVIQWIAAGERRRTVRALKALLESA